MDAITGTRRRSKQHSLSGCSCKMTLGVDEALWRSMTLEDIYGSAATERYMLDRLRMPLTDVGAAPLLTEEH
eukprot:4117495-Amphidinium_carterae.1